MINVLNDKDLFKLKNLTRFALSEKILYLVANYLEELPFLANIFITIGQPNETKTSSQLYHLDTEAEKNLKLFFYLSDVDDESGPFTFINKIDSMKIIKNTNYDGKRLEDSSIFSLEKNSQINENRFISNSGKGLAIDTANCLHYGSRNNKKDRIVLILYFTTHFTSHYYKHDLFKKINKSNLNKIQDGVVSHFNNEIFTDKKYLNTK